MNKSNPKRKECRFYYSRFFLVYFFISLLLLVFTSAETDSKFIKQVVYPYFDEQLEVINNQDYLSQASWLLDYGIGRIVSKYPQVCIPAMFQNIEWYYNPTTKGERLSIPSDFKKRLPVCFHTNAEFILLPMSLFNEATGAGHQTLLLFNNELKTVEFYDPQGIYLQEDYFNSVALHETLNSVFDKMGLGYNVHNAFPAQWSENYKCSLGSCDEMDYCVSWTLWYIEFRLKNPNKSMDELNLAMSKYFLSDTNIISRYATGLIKLSEKVLIDVPETIALEGQVVPLPKNLRTSVYKASQIDKTQTMDQLVMNLLIHLQNQKITTGRKKIKWDPKTHWDNMIEIAEVTTNGKYEQYLKKMMLGYKKSIKSKKDPVKELYDKILEEL